MPSIPAYPDATVFLFPIYLITVGLWCERPGRSRPVVSEYHRVFPAPVIPLCIAHLEFSFSFVFSYRGLAVCCVHCMGTQ